MRTKAGGSLWPSFFKLSHRRRFLPLLTRLSLCRQIRRAIDTWERVNQDGIDYYTHRSQQYAKKAYFKPAIENNQLAFYIVPAKNVSLTRDVYSYYIGHLGETFIRHFPTRFSWVQATPNPHGQDAAF